MPLPNFILIGAAKSGTTALYLALAQHPQVYMSPVKEPYFFACPAGTPADSIDPRHGIPTDAITDRRRYGQLFEGADRERVIGEATVYMHTPGAARRIREELPQVRLAAVLRNPVDRAYSAYWFLREIGVERAPTFEAALDEERARMRQGWPRGLFQDGLYHAQLEPFFKLFERERIRIYQYEQWRTRPRELLRDLFGFLAVDHEFKPGLSEVNISPVPGPMRDHTRHQLRAAYRDDVTKLQKLIGRDLSGWLES